MAHVLAITLPPEPLATAVVHGKRRTYKGTYKTVPVGQLATVYYRMRGRDNVCPTTSYVRWVVTQVADLTGVECPPGSLACGANPLTALSDICIEQSWTVYS